MMTFGALFVPFLIGSLFTAGWAALAVFLITLGPVGTVGGVILGFVFVLPGLVNLFRLLMMMVICIFHPIVGEGK